MKKLTKKPAPIEEEQAIIEAEETESEELTADEMAVLADLKEAQDEVSFHKMEKAVHLLENTFNLKGNNYVVQSFTDKGNKVGLSLTNGNFDVSITINDAEAFGLMMFDD